MRYLLCLVAGALFGALLALTAASALQRRNAWPRALMTVMQHELGAAREAARGDRCTAPQARSALAHLSLLAGDVEGALLAPGTSDRVFSQYAGELGQRVTAAAAAADCKTQAAALTEVSDACDACHRDYR